MFDRRMAVAAWRRRLEARGVFLKQDLDELERRLHDDIRVRCAAGRTEAEAFDEAVRVLGEFERAEHEYPEAVYGRKLQRPRRVGGEVRWRAALLGSHVAVALRRYRRQKLYAFINVFGLALGLAVCLVLFLYVRHEWSHDRFHDKADRIYRLTWQMVNVPSPRHIATTSPPMGPALVQEYPEVERFVRLRDPQPSIFTRGEARFYEEDFFYADSTFFDVFTFPLRAGNPATALTAINSVVLTAEAARKYFGDEDPMGRVLIMNGEVDLTVTGVLEPLPSNSQLRFDLLVSFATFRVPHGYPVTLESWTWGSFHTYLLLAEGADAAALEGRLPAFVRSHIEARRAARIRLRLQPITDVYLSGPRHPSIAAGNALYLYGLSVSGLLMLLLACFNFTNLATAHAIGRTRETGIRKALGAQWRQLMLQYLGESVLVALLSLGVALLLVVGFAAWTPGIGGWKPAFRAEDLRVVLPVFAVIACLTGLVAGSYPALLLARLRPAHVLKSGTGGSISRGRLRSALLVFQFVIAIGLLACTLIVRQQMAFIQEKDLGFEREQVIALRMLGSEFQHRYAELRQTLLDNPHVMRVTKGGDLFDGDQGSVPIAPEGGGEDGTRVMNIYSLYYDFVETMGLEVIAGRAPSETFPADSGAVLLNRAAAEVFASTVPGWDDPIGRHLRVGAIREGRVIGVVEDFHYASLHSEIEPVVLYFPRALVDRVLVRVRPGSASDVLASLERDWRRVAPDLPFQYTFLDEHIGHLYRAETHFARVTGFFTLLTLVVACLGLYGLVAFLTQLRTKEIGIRKVLGAGVPRLVLQLSKDYLRLVVAALVIATPAVYLVITQWLEGFAYRTEIGPLAFVEAGGATLLAASLAMIYQCVRAATADPVNSLRYE